MKQLTAIAVLVLCSARVGAQEIAWPVPASAPEQFLGARLNLDGFERYYDPFRAVTIFAADRRPSGTWQANLALGERGPWQGAQAEVEWYPLMGKGAYAYAGYALGTDAPFPRHRAGAEYFTSLPAGFEASLGLRLYDFRDRRTITMATGSAAMYHGNYWFSLRPYVSVNLPRNSFSLIATARYYFGERDEYVYVRVGAGLTPDERTALSTSGLPAMEVFTLHSQTLSLGGQWFAGKGWLAVVEGSFGRQEVAFLRGTYIGSASLLVGVRYSLR